MSQSPLGAERFEEHRLGQLGKYLGSNSTRQEHPARGLELEGEIARLGAEYGGENIQSLVAHRTLAGKGSMGDGGGRVGFYHLGYQPLRRQAAVGIPQKFKNID